MLGCCLKHWSRGSVFPCCRREKPNTQFTTASWIERIVILGISNAPKGIFLTADGMDILKSPFYCPDQHPSSPSVITHFVEFSFRRTCCFGRVFQTKIELFIFMTYLLHVVFVFPSRVIIFFLHYCSQLSGTHVECRTRYARLNWKQTALSITLSPVAPRRHFSEKQLILGLKLRAELKLPLLIEWLVSSNEVDEAMAVSLWIESFSIRRLS